MFYINWHNSGPFAGFIYTIKKSVYAREFDCLQVTHNIPNILSITSIPSITVYRVRAKEI